MKHILRLALALALALALLPLAGLAEEKPRRLTLMVYMCGSNLESAYGSASSDIQEMLDAGWAGDEVSVLVMTGGTRYWSMGFDARQCQIQELGRRGGRTVWRSEALNMGSSDTLAQLLRYGRENRPAGEYALILWDHGGGPMEGVCWDELFSLDHLSLEELRRGIEDAGLGQKLSWIGFDACLMGSLEVAGAVESCADYMIASQETEPATGWDYGFISGLSEDRSPLDTARRIVDGYMQTQVLQGERLTLACLDLGYVRQAMDALGDCFAPRAAGMNAERFVKLMGERAAATAFGQPLKAFGDSGYDLVDLKDLTARLDPSGDDGAALQRALDKLVVYSRSNQEGANGVSVYHPCFNKEKYRSAWQAGYKRLNVSAGYARYVDAYGRFLMGDAMTDWSGLQVEAGEPSDGRQGFALRLTPEQAKSVSSAQLLVMMSNQHAADVGRRQYSLVGAFPAILDGDGALRAEYDGRALFADDVGPLGYFLSPDGSLVTPVTYVPKEGELRINGLNGISVLAGDGGEAREYPLGTDTTPNVYFYVADAPEGARIDRVRIRDTATGMLSGRMAFSEEGYRGMVFWYPLKDLPEPDENGLLPEYALWDDTAGVHGVTMALPADWRFSIRHGNQPGSLLWAAFQLTDAQQNTWCTPPVAVDNPGLVPVELEDRPFETQDARLTVRATVSSAADTPGIWLDFEAENLGSPRRFYVCDLVLNGVREVEYGDSCYLEDPDAPGGDDLAGVGKGSIFVEARELAGLDALDTVDFTLRCREGNDRDTMTEARLTLALPHLDVGDIAPEMDVLGSAEGAGYAWDVLSVGRDYLNVNLLLRIRNTGGGTAAGEKAWAVVNGTTQLPGDDYVSLPGPGRELLLPLSFASRNRLRWAGDRFHMGDTRVDIVDYCLPDLLGDSPIEAVDLVFKRLGGQDWPVIPLRLNSPWVPPGPLPGPDDLWTVFHELCDDGAASEPLVRGPAIELRVDHLMVGLTGVGLLLKARNLTDRAVALNLDEAWIDDRRISVGRYDDDGARTIAPGAETAVVYALGTADDGEEYRAGALGTLRLLLRCDGGEGAWVALRPADGPTGVTPGGTVLAAGALDIEAPADAP